MIFMDEKILESTEVETVQKKQNIRRERHSRQRKDLVVLERLTSIALKMREIRRKASQPKSSELN